MNTIWKQKLFTWGDSDENGGTIASWLNELAMMNTILEVIVTHMSRGTLVLANTYPMEVEEGVEWEMLSVPTAASN